MSCFRAMNSPLVNVRAGKPVGWHPASGHLLHLHIIRHRMKAAPGGEGGSALFQRRRGLTGLAFSGASASVPGYRREVSSVTMSAADCGFLAKATLCPAHIESASISPVVPAIGGAGS